MKNLVFIYTLVLTTFAMGGEYRTFTSKEGQSVIARIVKHDSQSGKIQLERRGGLKVWAKPDLFSSEDQPFITTWLNNENFLNPTSFKISITEHTDKWRREDDGERDLKTTDFTINLNNTGNTDLNELRIEYCLYRKIRMRGEKFIRTDNKQIKESVSVGSKKETIVKNINWLSFKRSSDNFLNEIVGARFRIYMSTPEGQEILREVCFPESLSQIKYPWITELEAEKEKDEQMEMLRNQ